MANRGSEELRVKSAVIEELQRQKAKLSTTGSSASGERWKIFIVHFVSFFIVLFYFYTHRFPLGCIAALCMQNQSYSRASDLDFSNFRCFLKALDKIGPLSVELWKLLALMPRKFAIFAGKPRIGQQKFSGHYASFIELSRV